MVSCSTQKNTWITRTYHSITSHYNIYFNGNESFKNGIKKVNAAHKDDYGQLLPIFIFSSDNTAKAIAGDMDRTVKKTSKVIAMHSIRVKPAISKKGITDKEKAFYEKNEYNWWIDDSYILMGKAQYYKHDYKQAIETFKTLVRDFPKEPSHYTAFIWMARTYLEMKEMPEAQKLLELMASATDIPKKMLPDFHLTYADYFIRKGDFKEALVYLEMAYKEVKKKDERVRYAYILAQLSAKVGNNQKATYYYTEVIRMNPPYEMTFNAMINQAGALAEGTDVEQIRKQLNRLLKDEKNKEYRDQIYFALANLAMKESKPEEAMDLYKKSARASVTNTRQKARSFKTVADYYYQKPDYEQSQAYYDSTQTVIDQDFPDAALVTLRAKNLTKLVVNLRMVEFEDSVQKLAGLSEEARNEIIDKRIEKVRQDELEARQKETEKMQSQQFDLNFSQDNYMTQAGQASGAWYFYNQTVKTLGENEFHRKFGMRKNEDNWRRLDKRSVSLSDMGDAGTTEEKGTTETKKKLTDNKTREYYMQSIPLTDSLMQESNKRIMNALYNAGVVYMDNLNEPALAAKEFSELVRRFPENEHQLSAYYDLYTIYRDKKDNANAEVYKNLIISKYPGSQYANLLSNPHYLEELQAIQARVYHYYDTVYSEYKAKQFGEVIQKAGNALTEFKGSELVPKFSLLRAMAMGSVGDTVGYRDALKKLIADYPKKEEGIMAKDMLFYMDNRHPEMKRVEEEKKAEEIFMYDPGRPHQVAFVIPKAANMNQLIFNLINYNLDNYSKISLNVAGEPLGKDNMLITVKSFGNATDAINYLGNALASASLLKDVNAPSPVTFVISEGNLLKMKSLNSSDNYLLFYKKYFLEKGGDKK